MLEPVRLCVPVIVWTARKQALDEDPVPVLGALPGMWRALTLFKSGKEPTCGVKHSMRECVRLFLPTVSVDLSY